MRNPERPPPGDDHEYSLSVDHLPDLRLTVHVFAAHRRTVHRDWAYPEHEHPMFELNLVLDGRQQYRVGTETYVMEPGDVLLIRPEEQHTCEVLDGREMTYACIHFDADEPVLRQSLLSIREHLHRRGSPLAQEIGPLLARIGDGAERRDGYRSADAKLAVLGLAFELFGVLHRLLSEPPEGLLGEVHGHGGLAGRLAERLADRLVQAVRDRQHLSDEESFVTGSIERISRELGYSAAYCNRVFKSVFGMSPRRYLSTLKLREAKVLLVDRRLTVEQIAERLGYKDVSQFSKQFKRWMDISPSQYRQML